MYTFKSPQAFADLVTQAVRHASPEKYFRELLEQFQFTAAQASLGSRVMATLVPKKGAAETAIDPLAPTRAVAGGWRSKSLGRTSSGIASSDESYVLGGDFTYSYSSRFGSPTLGPSETRDGGIYIAGLAKDGYLVALCSVHGSADEMWVFPKEGSAVVGGTSFRRG